MYQLVVTVRETEGWYTVNAVLSEVLPQGGVAPLASRKTALPPGPERAIPDPFVGILQTVAAFAAIELENSGHIANIQGLF